MDLDKSEYVDYTAARSVRSADTLLNQNEYDNEVDDFKIENYGNISGDNYMSANDGLTYSIHTLTNNNEYAEADNRDNGYAEADNKDNGYDVPSLYLDHLYDNRDNAENTLYDNTGEYANVENSEYANVENISEYANVENSEYANVENSTSEYTNVENSEYAVVAEQSGHVTCKDLNMNVTNMNVTDEYAVTDDTYI
eukprot:Pgem_evm1s5207